MYRIKKTLSAKTNAEGKKQIHIQINVSRTCRPRLKTNVHVLPDCFDEKKRRDRYSKTRQTECSQS